MGKKKSNSDLGKSLTKRQKSRDKDKDGFLSNHHTTELADGYDWARLNLQSVTEESHLEEFLRTAELAGTDFTAEKLNVKFVKPSSRVGLLSVEDKKSIDEAQVKYKDTLSVPRRPKWNEFTTPEELTQLENQHFLEWRRKLAELEEVDNLTITPFEKNLQFWRQLWRVIERSDVVVQIVDSRNPLLFRCEDLEKYVKEVGSYKVNIILMNKADFLTPDQREHWSNYFDSIGLKVIFFSALEELNKGSDDIAITERLNDLEVSERSLVNEYDLVNTKQLIDIFHTIELDRTSKENTKTVGLVGYPNVGKSSTINAIFKEKKVSVSTTPGKTKHFQTLFVDEKLCLCDCPGLVMPKFVSNKAEMILNGILPIDQMRDHLSPMNLFCNLIPRQIIEETYSMILPKPQENEDPARPPCAEEVLNAYGYLRGYMTQRGLPDASRCARKILKDFVSGKLLFCVSPPGLIQEKYHGFKITKVNTKPIVHPKIKNTSSKSSKVTEEFFANTISDVHAKGKSRVPGYGSTISFSSYPSSVSSSTTNINDKPWKRHNNRQKKEKLRRIYGHLDN